jgi:hypothetical protein
VIVVLRTWVYAMMAGLLLCAGGCGGEEQISVAQPPAVVEKPFAEGGRVVVHIDSGDCEIRAASGAAIRTELSGNVGQARSTISVDRDQADVEIKDTPHNNFHCTVDIPKSSDLRVDFGGGALSVAPVADHTDVQSGAGNTDIYVTDAADYASVSASLAVGDLDADVFGDKRSGIGPSFSWTGKGTRTIIARSGAGKLRIRR